MIKNLHDVTVECRRSGRRPGDLSTNVDNLETSEVTI